MSRRLHVAMKRLSHVLAGTLLTFLPLQAQATLLDLSNIPLEVREGVPPNIILTMDDSGSMAWGFLPDDRDDGAREITHRFKSYVFNRMYYNPNITYLPGVDENGASFPDADFFNAWHHGYNPAIGTVDLSTDYRVTDRDYRPNGSVTYVGEDGPESTNINNVPGVPAYYYVFDSTLTTGGQPCDINNTSHVMDSDDCYARVTVSSTSGVNRYSPERTGCSPAVDTNAACYTGPDERMNFANWYSYYRLRHLVAKTATTRAFAGLSTAVRVAWQALNTSNTSIDDPLPFGGTHRSNFFNWVYNAPASGGTPLTDAFWRAGSKYESDADVYRQNPGDSSSPQYSCRQNFHFAFTDGYWNSNSVNTPGNYDGNDRTLPTDGNSPFGDINYQATTSLSSDTTPPIYRDGNSNYLADIAFYFWARDLRSSLEDNVPTFITDNTTDIDNDGDVDNYDIFWNPLNDPADWQHMVNFTVGLGVEGVLPFTTATYDSLLAGPDGGGIDWPGCGDSAPCKVDDLWHASINSRGRYFSASSPQQLIDGFQDVLDAIDERKGSSTALATTSSEYRAGTIVFQAIYDTNDWSGDIWALDATTKNLQWSAAQRLATQIANNAPPRVILSHNGTAGIPFQWTSLSGTQQTLLHTLDGTNDGRGSLRVAYLRGDNAQEQQNGGTFRNRSSFLGDVVHSDPIFVPPPGPPRFYYPDSLETSAYSLYVSSMSGRKNMLVFGANDGMVHVLDASDGTELLAYVPSPVYKNLSKLTDPGYRHEFYVNQPITVWDVYANGWKTVAIGGLGKGGQGIFALDISDPASFTEANASSLVLWEFTDADDADLGYTYTKPYIMRMNNGKWMVAFGNGYNANEADGNATTTGDALLFLLDIETGGKGTAGVLAKLSTETGMAEDPTGQGRANRLSDITAVDTDGNLTVDYIYAGDLFGNLWKFDVTDSNPANWSVYTSSNGTPTPLFVATDANGTPQPITTAPAIQYHRQKRGYLVYFGTGKYVENSDPADTSLQTFYAVWDRREPTITTIRRAHLLQQKIEGVNATQFPETEARLTTDNTMNWYNGGGLPTGNPVTEFLGWYLDLAEYDSNDNPILTGERIDGEIYVFGNRVEFQTLIPSTDPCVSGGISWLFALNATTGSRFLTASPWDYNMDGAFNNLDRVNFGAGQIWGSGIRIKTGTLFRRTKLLTPGECREVNILNMADGTLGEVTGNCTTNDVGRRSWRQLIIN